MKKTVIREYLGMLDTKTSTLRAILIKNNKLPDTEEETQLAIRNMRNFQKKHLKAYLRGQSHFMYYEKRFEVRQKWG